WSRSRVREATLAMRRTAMSELGPAADSVAAVLTGSLAVGRAAVLDALVTRGRPGNSRATPVPASVVVPTHGPPEVLERCLDGLEAQDPCPAEIVVVARPDDEPTAILLDRWRSADPQRHRVVHVHRPGLVYALDAGTRAVRAEVVAYLDDDAVPSPG